LTLTFQDQDAFDGIGRDIYGDPVGKVKLRRLNTRRRLRKLQRGERCQCQKRQSFRQATWPILLQWITHRVALIFARNGNAANRN